MNELMKINGVRGYLDENGMAQLNLEDVARGLGLTTVAKSGNVCVRWKTVEKYLKEFGVATSCNDGFIPENVFYKLCFKAKNQVAKKFQDMVTDEVLPSIRKHGAYMTPETIERVLLNPDTIIELAQTLKAEQEKNKALSLENIQQKQIIGELKPKATYYDIILNNKGLVTITQIAKDYGMSGRALNKMLHELGIQYKMSDQWLLYRKYHDEGYTHSQTQEIPLKDGTISVKMNTKWTQKGRLFLYDLLKANNIYPVIEQQTA